MLVKALAILVKVVLVYNITMTAPGTKAIRYLISKLKLIGWLAKARENYHIFSLDNTTRSRIMSSGIGRYERQYRISRASRNLFHHIHIIVSNWVNPVNAFQPTIDWTPGLFSKAIKCIKPDKENKTPRCHLWSTNCWSAGNKSQRIQTEIINNKLDILALTETWFKEDNNIIPPRRTCPMGYKVTSLLRSKRSGGGIALIHSDDIWIDKFQEHRFSSMECSDFKLHIGKQKSPVNLAVLYKSPNTSILQFTLDLVQYLESSITDHGKHILCRDFNIKVNDTQDPNTITTQDFLDSFYLKNNVLFPTH